MPKAARTRWKRIEIDPEVLPHRDDAKRVPRDNNPMWPLPPYYAELPEEEQTWWRVNACCVQEDPSDFLVAHSWFVRCYLWPDDAMFYVNKRPSPLFHYQMVHDVAAFRLNAFGAPREYCKSTKLRELHMLMALTRRGWRSANASPTQKKSRDFLGEIKDQFSNNPYILHDFGRIRPQRGDRSWSNEILELATPFWSSIEGLWMGGAMRGTHVDFLSSDDVETDPITGKVDPELTAWMSKTLLRVYLPMIQITADDLDERPEIARRGGGFALSGTVIQEMMMLAQILDAEPGSEWDFWNRWRIESENGAGQYSWKARYGKKSSDLLRRILGNDVFDSEMRNRPGASAAGTFNFHPTFHGYDIIEPDNRFLSDPYRSDAVLRFSYRKDPRPEATPIGREIPVATWLSSMEVAILIDWAGTADGGSGGTGDFTCFHVVGYDYDYCLWSLDLAMGRWSILDESHVLADLIFKWKPRRIGMESIAGYGKVSDLVMNNLRPQLMATLGWLPLCQKIGYHTRAFEKGSRIARSAYRFETDKIRLPYYRRHEPAYREAFHEITFFSPSLSGLKHDDFVDTLGFVPEFFRGPGGAPIAGETPAATPIIELIESGQTRTPEGTPLAALLPDYSALTPKAMEVLARGNQEYQKGRGRFERPPRQTIGGGPIILPPDFHR